MQKKGKNIVFIIGVDEAGRGPLAGPVAVAAMAVKRKAKSEKLKVFEGIRDSKKLSEKQREEWFAKFKRLKKEGAINYAVSFSSAKVIDEKGIVVAIRRALARSLKRLCLPPESCKVLLDGTLYAPAEYKNQKTIIRGDDLIPIISAASVVAKVSRDRKIKRMAKKFPDYGFDAHKGYGTRAHYRAIKKIGISEIHRRTFL